MRKGVCLLEETEGVGRPIVNGDTVEVKLDGWLNNGDPIQTDFIGEIMVGKRSVIPGIEYSLIGMKRNGFRRVKISPHLGYGEAGLRDLIPPNALLIYEITVTGVR